jgi:cytochrome c peroxidase
MPIRLPVIKRLVFVLLCSQFRFALLAAETGPGISEWKQRFSRPATIPFPSDNPYSPQKEELGRMLFFDPRLSGSGWISCATCHNPGLSWGDALPKGIGAGMKTLPRRTPSILNLAWSEVLFWDGRAESLEEQATGPITASCEMNRDMPKLIANLQALRGYREGFRNAFPGEPIGAPTLAKALATFERTVVSAPAPCEAWLAGDESAVPESAKRGFGLFIGKAGCVKCHSGWNFTDGGFHDIGLGGDDPGRGRFLNLPSQQHAFKTPGLRNTERRGPWMHDGSLETLSAVIEFYDRGGVVQRPGLSPDIRPLHLTENEKRELLAFLKTLTSDDSAPVYPKLPR